MGVTEILCSFRLALEEKTGKEIPTWLIKIRVFRKVFSNFALSDAEGSTSGLLNRGAITDLSLLRILLAIRQKPPEPNFWTVMESFANANKAYASLTASRNLLQRLLIYLNLNLDSEDLFCQYKRKKLISMNYSSNTSSRKTWRWARLDLILMMRDIYITSNLKPHTKIISSRGTKFKDILTWSISQMIMKTISINTRIVTRCAMKRSILLWILQKINGNSDNNIIRITQWSKSHCRTNTSIRRNK